MEWALTLGGSVLFAEFTGYWVHRLLHSERIPYLSRSHMIHHLRDYGPDTSMRPSASYRKATDTRAGIAGIGFEWLLPIALSLCVVLTTLTVLGVGLWPQLLFSLSSIGWGVLMFSYMHDSMHCRNFWMERHSLLRKWYRRARRNHDIHHLLLHPSGRMHRNFGICFFGMDRLFGTFARKASRPEPELIALTRARYAAVIGPTRSDL